MPMLSRWSLLRKYHRVVYQDVTAFSTDEHGKIVLFKAWMQNEPPAGVSTQGAAGCRFLLETEVYFSLRLHIPC
jgi:hypothetical protein